jgi:hypothetical protein
MAESAKGVGVGANDATTKAESKDPAIDAAERAVAKARQQLEWAERALAQARKEK